MTGPCQVHTPESKRRAVATITEQKPSVAEVVMRLGSPVCEFHE